MIGPSELFLVPVLGVPHNWDTNKNRWMEWIHILVLTAALYSLYRHCSPDSVLYSVLYSTTYSLEIDRRRSGQRKRTRDRHSCWSEITNWRRDARKHPLYVQSMYSVNNKHTCTVISIILRITVCIVPETLFFSVPQLSQMSRERFLFRDYLRVDWRIRSPDTQYTVHSRIRASRKRRNRI